MTLSLDLDALEICRCKRLICDDDDCDVLRRLADGEFYREPKTGDEKEAKPEGRHSLSVDEWRERHAPEVAA